MASLYAQQMALNARMAEARRLRGPLPVAARPVPVFVAPPLPPPPPVQPEAEVVLTEKEERRRKRREAKEREQKKQARKKRRVYVPPAPTDPGKSLYELAVEGMARRPVPPPPVAGEGIGELKHSSVRGKLTKPFVKKAMKTEAVTRALQRYGKPIMEVPGHGGAVQEIDLLLPAKVDGCVRYKELRAEPEFQRRLLREYSKFLKAHAEVLAQVPASAESEAAKIRWCEAYLDSVITRHLEMEAYQRHRAGRVKATAADASILALAARFRTAF